MRVSYAVALIVFILTTALLTGTLVNVNAQTKPVTVDSSMGKWGSTTLFLKGPSATETQTNPNPFLDYRFTVRFIRPSGTEVVVPGYFAGDGAGGVAGDVWKAHLAPDEVGEWQYEILFHSGTAIAVNSDLTAGTAINSFNGLTGTFTVGETHSSLSGFYKWGILEYVGKHYLKFREGPYYIKGGADSPENLLGYTGFDQTPNAKHSYTVHGGIGGLVQYLSDHHVNSVYFLPMNIGGDAKDTYPHPAENDKVHYDNSKLDQWNGFFTQAQQHGVYLHIVLAEAEAGNKQYYDGGGFGNQRKLYFRELIARFSHHNALQWNIGEEFNAGWAGAAEFTPEQVRVMAAYLKLLDPYDHPVTVHNAGSINSLDQFMGDQHIDLSSYQQINATTNNGRDVESKRGLSAASGKPWVISFDEIQTLTTANPDTIRKAALWPIYLSGGQVEWYIKAEDQTLEDFSRYETHWDQTWYARKFMEEIPFWDMIPHDEYMNSPGNGQVLALVGKVYALYTPTKTTVIMTIPGGSYTLRWYDPQTGQFLSPGTMSGGNNISLGASPCTDDCAAIIVRDGFTVLSPTPSPTLRPTLSPTPLLSTTPTQQCTLTGDIDCSGEVNIFDLSRLLASWGMSDSATDIDKSGSVNIFDLSIVLSHFGEHI